MSETAGAREVSTGAGHDPAPWWERRHLRLRLSPAVPRVLRGRASLQVGTGERAQVLDGLVPGDWPTVALLSRGASREAVEVDARRRGIDPARALRIVELLAEARAVVTDDGDAAGSDSAASRRLRAESAVWSGVWPCPGSARADHMGPARDAGPVPWQARERVAERSQRHVTVRGGGGLGSLVTACLAASGVGRAEHDEDRDVRPCDVLPGGPTMTDVSGPAGPASADAVQRVTGRAPPGGGSPVGGPDVVVLARAGAADATDAYELVQDGIPHLPVVVREDDIVVGPLVVPGRTACLHCMDHHRRDADPGWPAALRQLLIAEPLETAPVPALAQLACGLTTLLTLAYLDGRALAPVGAAVQVRLPDGALTWRCWRPHPECGCNGMPQGSPAPAVRRGRSRVPPVPAAPADATMST